MGNIWNKIGNGVRVNIKDFVKSKPIFKHDGEYTWRAEIIHEVNIKDEKYPDNMIYEGVLPGSPGFFTPVTYIKGLDTQRYLPLAADISKMIKPPYYVDFLDKKFENGVNDVPVTYDEVKLHKDGYNYSVLDLDAYSSTSQDAKTGLRACLVSRHAHLTCIFSATLRQFFLKYIQYYCEKLPSFGEKSAA